MAAVMSGNVILLFSSLISLLFPCKSYKYEGTDNQFSLVIIASTLNKDFVRKDDTARCCQCFCWVISVNLTRRVLSEIFSLIKSNSF